MYTIHIITLEKGYNIAHIGAPCPTHLTPCVVRSCPAPAGPQQVIGSRFLACRFHYYSFIHHLSSARAGAARPSGQEYCRLHQKYMRLHTGSHWPGRSSANARRDRCDPVLLLDLATTERGDSTCSRRTAFVPSPSSSSSMSSSPLSLTISSPLIRRRRRRPRPRRRRPQSHPQKAAPSWALACSRLPSHRARSAWRHCRRRRRRRRRRPQPRWWTLT